MASPSDDGDLGARIEAMDGLEWERPSDLNRRSLEGLWTSGDAARKVRSSGSIRLFGVNVRDHHARLDAAGAILVNFQRLITAAGAARRGIRTAKGPLPAEVTSLTQLKLLMSPLPGSVVFEIGPETLPETELAAEENVAIFDQPNRQFVDECFTDALGLVAVAHEIGLRTLKAGTLDNVDGDEDVDGAFEQRIADGGPRLAVAVRDFAKVIESAEFDVDLEWREPLRPTLRATMTKSDAAAVARLVVSHELDAEDETIRGSLVTISVMSSWQIRSVDGELTTVDASVLTAQQASSFRLGEDVTILARPKVTESAGGIVTTKFTVIEIKSNDPEQRAAGGVATSD